MNRKAYITLFLFGKKKTCAKRKKDMAKSYLCEYKTKVLEMNRKAYIGGRRNNLHSSVSDGRAEERYIINTEKYEERKSDE